MSSLAPVQKSMFLDNKLLQPQHTKVPFSQIEKKEKEIEKKYEIRTFNDFLKVCNWNTKKQIVIRTVTLEAKQVFDTAKQASAIGGTIGCFFGGAAGITVGILTKNPLIAAKVWLGIAGAGVSLGLTVGVFIAVHKAIKRADVSIVQSDEYTLWKAGLQKEKYDLFLNCLKNYSKMKFSIDTKQLECSITHEFPDLPVESPNGHVYNLKDIEEHLELAWKRVETYKNEGRSEKAIEEQMQCICPMRGKPFKKEDLKFSHRFVTKAIEIFKKLKKELQVHPNDDPNLMTGLLKILNQYQKMYRRIRRGISLNLARELGAQGATQQQTDIIVNAYKRRVILM